MTESSDRSPTSQTLSGRLECDLEVILGTLARDAARAEFPDAVSEDFDPVVRPSKFADYQINGALPLAKRLERPPREVANAIARRLDAHTDILQSTEVAGPGFINCSFSNGYIASVIAYQLTDDRLGRKLHEPRETVVIDYGSPNVAKEMHVGHLRSTVIGDALTRVLTGRGDAVVRQNHLGDWGTQFGMLIEYLSETERDALDRDAYHVQDLDSTYRSARAKFDADDDFKTRARERVVALQSGDAETLRVWNMLVEESKRHFDELFQRLDTLLTADDYRGESMYNDQLDDTVRELDERGLLSESEGALCAFPEGFRNPEGNPLPLIVRKSDGGYGYAATDLAALRYAVRHDKASSMLYVTDGRQAQHFAMVMAVARDAGWLEHTHAQHVPFGMVLGKDGKPFKTREGNTARLADLIDESIERAEAVLQERRAELTADDIRTIANAVAIGALKWADLKNDRTQNYVFDAEAMTSFDGNTGPYVQYAATRARSVLRKAGATTVEPAFHLTETAERELALHLAAYGNAIERVVSGYEPHHLCTYLYELAGRFSSFYESCPVITASSQQIRDSRLALCDLTGRVLEDGLGQLGIRALEKM